MREIYAEREGAGSPRSGVERLVTGDLARLNDTVRELGQKAVVVPEK